MATTGSETGPEYADEFAEFSSQLSLDILGADVLEAVKADLLDTLACAAAGVSAKGVDRLIGLVSDWGGKPEASILCSNIRVPAHHAAWVNGMMSHARDFDDTHDAAVLHAGVSVVPAALAAAEAWPDASGEDLLCGIAAGLELICRLGVATKIGIVESGYMYTSLFGHFGATAAAARVARLDHARTVNALGIAYSQAAGNHQVTRDAALTKRVQPGFAAKTGLISVAMSLADIKGVHRTFEGADGLFRTYLRSAYDPERLRSGLGSKFDLVDLSFKPYPCCRFNHTCIDAVIDLRKRIPADATIKRIGVGLNRQAYEAVGTPIEMRRNPTTIVQAQFSIPYTAACAMLRGSVGLSDFTDAALRDHDVIALANLVDVAIDPDIERDWSRNVSPAAVVVETDQGRFEARVDAPKGDRKTPMTESDSIRKLDDCLAASGIAWRQGTSDQLQQAVAGLDQGGSASGLISIMTPA